MLGVAHRTHVVHDLAYEHGRIACLLNLRDEGLIVIRRRYEITTPAQGVVIEVVRKAPRKQARARWATLQFKDQGGRAVKSPTRLVAQQQHLRSCYKSVRRGRSPLDESRDVVRHDVETAA